MAKYKIIFLNSSKEWGGNERWTVSACNALVNAGHEVVLAFRKDIFSDKLDSRVKLFYLPFKSEIDLKTYSLLHKFNKNFKADILFPTKRKDYAIAGFYSKFHFVKVIFRLGIMRKFKKRDFIQKYIYSHFPDKIIVNAEAIKQDLVSQNFIKPELIEVIYNGYNFDEKIHAYKLPKDIEHKFIFASAGRLAPQKGYDVLLKAVNILSKSNHDFHLIIAGEGSSRKDYEKYIKENSLENHVSLIGNISNVRGLFAASDAVIIPSRNEGIPNTLMEAWSVKKPVLAAKSAGIPEAIQSGENGLLFDLDENEIESAMLKIISNRENEHIFGEAGYNTLMEKFTLNKMTEHLEYVFEQILRG